MIMKIIIIFILIKLSVIAYSDYWYKREQFINLDASHAVGSSIILNEKEQLVNAILMEGKLKEYDKGFNNPKIFAPSIHFFKSKELIDNSTVFDFIKKLPKGSSLHSHDSALASGDFVYNLTFSKNLYGCIINNRLKLRFFGNNIDNFCHWKLISELRETDHLFDDFLKTQLNIICDDPLHSYKDINDVWTRFGNTFSTVVGMISYKPVFEDYFYQSLKELYEDNVIYLEFRGTLFNLYDLNGKIYNEVETVKSYIKTLQRFKYNYPKFHGARFIYAPYRNVDNKTVDDYVKIAINIKTLYPDFIAGFDLVGQEDKGKPLEDFVNQILQLSGKMNFFFHAGETNWNGATTDLNLFDAILLNSTRIGHAFGIVKHPEILKIIKQRLIALEISPISNQVLKLVNDLRNHPANILLAENYPVVICCDDPSFWGAKGLSYDWYMAFMGMTSRNSNLKLLKKLAINSIKYSSMSIDEKQIYYDNWNLQWDEFLDKIIQFYNCNNKNIP